MELTAKEFALVANLVRKQSAIVLEQGKEYLVIARLSELAKSEGLSSLRELLSILERAPLGNLHTKVVEAMTTNETFFFRDILPFTALEKTIIPNLIEKRSSEKTLTLLSAASSTGQEAYSIAMVINHHFPEIRDWQIKIIGADLSSSVLAKARSGIYTQFEVNRGLPAPFLVKYFVKRGSDWIIKDVIRSMVSFEQMNLVEPWAFQDKFDVIFLRNVLIYFDLETKRRVFEHVKGHLRESGFLILGSAESPTLIDSAFRRYGNDGVPCYQVAGGS